MHFKVRIELLNQFEKITDQFDSSSVQHVIDRFDQIDWMQQAVWGFMEENNGEFPFFQIEQPHTGRKFGGLFVVYSRQEYNFMAHATLYQKQIKTSFFGLFKSEQMPSFDNSDLPFEVFRKGLEQFMHSNDSDIERLMRADYPSYSTTGFFDR